MKQLRFRRWRFYTVLVINIASAGLASILASVAEIPIPNHSFENPVVSDGSTSLGNVPGWVGVGEFAVGNPANDYFFGTTDGGGQNPIDGSNAVALNIVSKISYQDSNVVVRPNAIYELTALVGRRIGVPFGTPSLSLWAGTTLLAEGFPSPIEGRFIGASISYTSPPSGDQIGKPVRIEFKAGGVSAQAWFDNVHLYETSVVCTPHKATATGELFNGIFVGATITEGGCGYTNPPVVLIKGGGGNGAAARAIITDGKVTEIRVTNGGCCYTNVPQVIIGSPPFVPSLSINVSRINVNQNVVLGWRYVLESSTNNIDWIATGPSFVADSESVAAEFDVIDVGKFFRLRVVP